MTPLRYPGGKARLFKYFHKLIQQNKLYDCEYAEGFCGGAGLGIELLRASLVSAIRLNDLDRAVYAFWHCAVNETDELCERIAATRIDMDTWWECKQTYQASDVIDLSELGFATFFLNRTNRSGILRGGVIGGYDQTGPWKIDARFNKIELIERIRSIGRLRSRIVVSRLDAIDLVNGFCGDKDTLIYLDPPYVDKGPDLYLNAYDETDHANLAAAVKKLKCHWVVSYDDNPLVRKLYDDCASGDLKLHYSAQAHMRIGRERIYFSPGLTAPDMGGVVSRYRMPWAA